jgi:hypothetical protein
MTATLATAVLAWALPAAPPDDGLTARLTLTPAAAPDPALRYELLPRLADRTPGDAATAYTRAFLLLAPTEQPNPPVPHETIVEWLHAAPEKFPADKAKGYLARYEKALREVERAARHDRCHWNSAERIKAGGSKTPLPEVTKAAEAARLLALRARVELADGRTADAIQTLRTVLQIARHVGEGASLVHAQYARAVCLLAVDRVEELVRHPDAPNLYWALAGLPAPFIDPAPGLEGHELMIRAMFPTVGEFEAGPVPVDRADRALNRFFDDAARELGVTDRNKLDGPGTRLRFFAVVAVNHEAARKELVRRGIPAAEADAMPPVQVVFLASWERYRSLWDTAAKSFR